MTPNIGRIPVPANKALIAQRGTEGPALSKSRSVAHGCSDSCTTRLCIQAGRRGNSL